MSSSLDLLANRMPPPTVPAPEERSWDEIEVALNVRFSADYRAVMQTYGSGSIAGELSWVDPRRSAFDRAADGGLALLRSPDGALSPLPAFPASGPSLLPVASNGNGEYVFLIVTDGVAGDQELWVGHVAERSWALTRGPFSAFLHSVVSGTSDLVGRLSDAWELRPVFVPQTGTRRQYAGRLVPAPDLEPRGTDGALERLKAWVPPPATLAPPDLTWPEAGERLGVRFPPEYRALVDAYGDGMMGTLRLADPRRDESVDWMVGVRSRVAGSHPAPPVPASADDDRFLMPVAVAVSSGDTAFLVVTDGVATDSELWIGNLYSGEWTHLSGSLPVLVDLVLSDTEAWGVPRFRPIDSVG